MAENSSGISSTTQGLGRIFKSTDMLIPALMLVVIMFMLFPLPTSLLDVFLALNLTASILIMLVTVYTQEPLQFSSFPSLLLIATLVRLGFNVAATRLILSTGEGGQIIAAFGNFVAGNDAIVGFVVFVILVVIQFVVITSGAQRVSEVAARFTLDAMPGKQMAIDADLNGGLITEQEARTRREKISREASFYGAMDGASKFVRGDAIAAIIIVAITIIGGFMIGLFRDGIGWDEVLRKYTLLTIGNGLVAQVPALIIATATGILVTRNTSTNSMGQEITGQILDNPRPLALASIALAIMGLFFPGWSRVPMLLVAAGAATGYVFLERAQRRVATTEREADATAIKPREPENVAKLLTVDPLELEVGFGLISLVDEAQGGDLLDRVTMIRRQVALDLGVVVPPIRIRDNMQLASESYVLKLRGTEVARGELMANRFLAINSAGRQDQLPGTKTKEPTFGLPAVWIEEHLKPQAERQGYTVVDLPSVIATHLTELVRSHAAQMLTRQDTAKLIEGVRQNNTAVVEELTPSQMSVGDIQRVLQNLLKERVPVRDLVTIFETLADHARGVKDSDQLTEFVRQSLYRTITRQHLGPDHVVHGVTLDARLEQTMLNAIHRGEGGAFLALDPRAAQKVITSLSKAIEALGRQGHAPLVLCSPAVRPYFKRLVEKLLPNLAVISYNELDPKTEIQTSGMVSIDENTTV